MTRSQVRAAELGRNLTQEERRRLEMDLIAAAARAYHAVTLAEEGLKLALEAARSAEADVKRAETVRAAGMATEADVLAVRVHLSSMQEQIIRRKADVEVSRAALNQSMGMPLDSSVSLSTPLSPAALAPAAAAELEKTARDKRPEVKMTLLAQSMAQARGEEARAMRLPQVGLRASFEADRKEFVRKGGANWIFAAQVRWNLFDGNRAKQVREEARFMAESAAAEQKNAASAVALQVRQALAGARSAQERITVASSAIAQAEETLRIVQNRYGAGLAAVTEVLRAQTALLETKTRRLAAIYDQRMAAVAVEHAAGTLQGDSDVLR
jgi:outer membrane protein TolC